MTKRELKQTMQRALRKAYGFGPTLNAIILLEATSDGSYILAEVNGHTYNLGKRGVEKVEE